MPHMQKQTRQKLIFKKIKTGTEMTGGWVTLTFYSARAPEILLFSGITLP